MRISIAALAALTLFPGHSSWGQGHLVLAPGTHIRYSLSAGERAVEAEVIVQRGDSLWLRSLQTGRRLAVALPDLSRLDTSRGRDRHTLRGAGIGLLGGAAAPDNRREPWRLAARQRRAFVSFVSSWFLFNLFLPGSRRSPG